jgi:hypothetical protein|tara:strand:- start:368 stop:532 length:165 start_codon:yes stop_codon:yes gene_type:complete
MSKNDVGAAVAGVGGATWLGLGDLNAALAIGVAGLTICLLLIRIALAVREWRRR